MKPAEPRPYVLSEARWGEVRDLRFEVAVLPWGATEAHNQHLPYSTDNAQVTYLAEQAAARVWATGRKLMVLPCIPLGIQSAQIDVPFTLNLRAATQHAILRDIVESLERQNIRKLLLINGHGGNNFVNAVRDLYLDFDVRIVLANWYSVVDAREFFAQPGDHAGEMETSLMLHVAPELCSSLETAGAGKSRRFRMKSLRDGVAWSQRAWLDTVTRDTGVGDPSQATAEKGARLAEAVVEKLARLLEEFHDVDLDDFYEDTWE